MQSRGDHHRDVCIIPVSAHGTNPASAAMCGMKIVAVGTDSKGNINIEELRNAAEANKNNLAALMVWICLVTSLWICSSLSLSSFDKFWWIKVTYPSTHGVYEEGIDEICKIIHDNGGQVYMDGANMNAQVKLYTDDQVFEFYPFSSCAILCLFFVDARYSRFFCWPIYCTYRLVWLAPDLSVLMFAISISTKLSVFPTVEADLAWAPSVWRNISLRSFLRIQWYAQKLSNQCVRVWCRNSVVAYCVWRFSFRCCR